MKKLNLLLAFMFIGVIASAHGGREKSELSVKLWNNSTFKIMIDNHAYDKTNNLYLKNLSTGVHRIKVYKYKNNHHNNSGFVKLLYSGTIRIPENSKVIAVVTPHRGLKLKVVKKHHNNYAHNDFHPQQECNHYGDCEPNCTNYSGDSGYNMAMSEFNFNRLLQSILNETFDDDRLAVASFALKNNNLNTEQVIVLMEQFTFDSSKLSFAKIAYSSTLDKESYFLVSNGFTFSRSKNKLLEYINNYH